MSTKKDIELAVKHILEKEEPPLASALKYEVANYNQAILKIKLNHRENLQRLLDVFRQRGAADSETAKKIEERLTYTQKPVLSAEDTNKRFLAQPPILDLDDEQRGESRKKASNAEN